MIDARGWMRRLLCRVGWDAACDRDATEIEEQRARMQALTWQWRAAIRRVVGEE